MNDTNKALKRDARKILKWLGDGDLEFSMNADNISAFSDARPSLFDDIRRIRQEFYPVNDGRHDYDQPPFPWAKVAPRIAKILADDNALYRGDRDCRWNKATVQLFRAVFTNEIPPLTISQMREYVFSSLPRPYAFEFRTEGGRTVRDWTLRTDDKCWYVESVDGIGDATNPDTPVRRTEVTFNFFRDFSDPDINKNYHFLAALESLGNPDRRRRSTWEDLYAIFSNKNSRELSDEENKMNNTNETTRTDRDKPGARRA